MLGVPALLQVAGFLPDYLLCRLLWHGCSGMAVLAAEFLQSAGVLPEFKTGALPALSDLDLHNNTLYGDVPFGWTAGQRHHLADRGMLILLDLMLRTRVISG